MTKLKVGQVWCSRSIGDEGVQITRVGPIEVEYIVLATGATYTALIYTIKDAFTRVPYNLKLLATMKNTIKKQKELDRLVAI